jgi:hypothetical protein
LFAQARGNASSDATGICKDSTLTVAATQVGACAKHDGLQTWWGLGDERRVRAALPESSLVAPRVASPAAKAGSKSPREVPGKAADTTRTDSVWINTRSMIYHCKGSQWFGKTVEGRFEKEKDALAKGARPAYGRQCGTPTSPRPN